MLTADFMVTKLKTRNFQLPMVFELWSFYGKV